MVVVRYVDVDQAMLVLDGCGNGIYRKHLWQMGETADSTCQLSGSHVNLTLMSQSCLNSCLLGVHVLWSPKDDPVSCDPFFESVNLGNAQGIEKAEGAIFTRSQ